MSDTSNLYSLPINAVVGILPTEDHSETGDHLVVLCDVEGNQLTLRLQTSAFKSFVEKMELCVTLPVEKNEDRE